MNAVVDLPFALSPVTVGLAAVLLFGTGGWFADFFTAQGIQILFALPSMVLVTIFICIPFTIRELVPVLEEFGLDEEDASRTLGASIWQTFRRVTLPEHPVGAPLRDRADDCALDRGDRRRADRERDDQRAAPRRRRSTSSRRWRNDWSHRRTSSPWSSRPSRSSCWWSSSGCTGATSERGVTTMSMPIKVETLTKRFGDLRGGDRRVVHGARPARSPRCSDPRAPARAPFSG